ncbi:MAG: diguanylate cyclase [Treponema sp.]|nr:diguanylate cyclase [Treponema sp.]
MNNYFESVFLIIISLFCFLYAVYFLQRNEKGTSAAPFAAANIAMGIWNLLRAVENAAPARYYLLIGTITYLDIEFSAYTLFWFSYRYSVPNDKQRKVVAYLPLIFPAATIIALIYKQTSLFALVGTKPLHLWDYLHVIYGYGLISTAAVLFIIRCIFSFHKNKNGYMILTTILIVFITQNFARYLNRLGYLPEITTTIGFFYDVCTFLLVNLSFIAMYSDSDETLISQCRRTLFEKTDMPLFVFNSNDEFLTANESAGNMIIHNTNTALHQYMKYNAVFSPEVFRRLGVSQTDSEKQMFYLSNIKTGEMYFCTKQPVCRIHSKKEIGYCCTLFDLDSYNMLFKNMEAGAYSDPLTGCLNSSSFFMNVRVELQSTHEQCLLVAAGLDNLTEINTLLGHRVGDTYIAAAAQILRDTLPENRIYRMESSTFTMMLPVSQLSDISRMLSEIRSACDRYSRNTSYPLVISAGYAVIEDRNSDVNAYYGTAFSNMMLDRRRHASV